MSYLKESHEVLMDIVANEAYINIAMQKINDGIDRALVTKIVYGTIEHYFECEYILHQLIQNMPRPAIKVVMLQATYALLHLNVPQYAIVNESVSLVEELGKKQQKGFVNAILKKICRKEFTMPKKGEPRYLEVKYNLPQWLINEVRRVYPAQYDKILSAEPRIEEHIRLSSKMDSEKFLKLSPDAEETLTGYFTRNIESVKNLYERGMLTYQSLTSTFAIKAMGDVLGKSMLDVCSAPGGKAVYAAELGASVVACDVHPHRVELIKGYAKRMDTFVNAVVKDGTAYKKEWAEKFDVVLIDAPCSGLGVLTKRRDIALKRSLGDISSLVGIQKRLLSVASKYVKKGGILIYSTCTILPQENKNVVSEFLASSEIAFQLDTIPLPYDNSGEIQFLPNNEGLDGFYIARLKRI
ncbi:MAG: transcription antitermination factor NusB [Bacillota bacterium]